MPEHQFRETQRGKKKKTTTKNPSDFHKFCEVWRSCVSLVYKAYYEYEKA